MDRQRLRLSLAKLVFFLASLAGRPHRARERAVRRLQIWSNQLRLIWKGQRSQTGVRWWRKWAMARVHLIGTADTKGEELACLASCLRARGAEVTLVDVGTGTPADPGRRAGRRGGGAPSGRARRRRLAPATGGRRSRRWAWPLRASSRNAPGWPACWASAAAAAPRSSRRGCANCPTVCPSCWSRRSPRAIPRPMSAFRT